MRNGDLQLRIRYTVCFITRGDRVLMLFRNKPPNQGLWNGVGGHIEKYETPRESCIREIQEETGYLIPDVKFGGLLTWTGFEIEDGGLYIYTAEAPETEPMECDEGILRWFSIERVCSSKEFVSNISYFLPVVLKNNEASEFYFEYAEGEVKRHLVRSLPDWLDLSIV